MRAPWPVAWNEGMQMGKVLNSSLGGWIVAMPTKPSAVKCTQPLHPTPWLCLSSGCLGCCRDDHPVCGSSRSAERASVPVYQTQPFHAAPSVNSFKHESAL
jgi:hypothetical protein